MNPVPTSKLTGVSKPTGFSRPTGLGRPTGLSEPGYSAAVTKPSGRKTAPCSRLTARVAAIATR